MNNYLLVFLGGGLGSVARYFVSNIFSTINNGEGNLGFPYFLYCYRGNPLFEYGDVQVNGGSNALANPGGNKPPGRNP